VEPVVPHSLKMEETISNEMSVLSAHTIRLHIPEHRNLYSHNRDSLKGVHKFQKLSHFPLNSQFINQSPRSKQLEC